MFTKCSGCGYLVPEAATSCKNCGLPSGSSSREAEVASAEAASVPATEAPRTPPLTVPAANVGSRPEPDRPTTVSTVAAVAPVAVVPPARAVVTDEAANAPDVSSRDESTSIPTPMVPPPRLEAPRLRPDLLPFEQPAPSDRGRRTPWRLLTGAGIALAIIVIGVVAVAWYASRGGRSYPAHWDARIAPIAAADVRLRGLSYDHPVPVHFLDEAAFKRRVGVSDKITPAQRREIGELTSELRALGLLAGGVDLLHAVDSEQQSATLAFYDPAAKEIVVRGVGPLDPAHRVTLAHELTHVLQDQHFDLQALQDAHQAGQGTVVGRAQGDHRG